MLFLAADHAGFELKEKIKEKLAEKDIVFEDLGTHSSQPADYPEYADKLTHQVVEKEGQGILFCGSGEGMAIVANRHPGARASVVWDSKIAKETREDNDANIISLPARDINDDQAWEIVQTFLETPFSHAERHERRLEGIKAVEEEK